MRQIQKNLFSALAAAVLALAAAPAPQALASLKSAASRLQKTAPSEWAKYQKQKKKLERRKGRLNAAYQGFKAAEDRLDREIKKTSLLSSYKKAYSELKRAELEFFKASPGDLKENQDAWTDFNHSLGKLSSLLPKRDRKWIEPWGTATTFWNSKKKYRKFREKQRKIKYENPEKWGEYRRALGRLQASMSAAKRNAPKEWEKYKNALNKYRSLGHEARQAVEGGKVDFWEKAFDELEEAVAGKKRSGRHLREALAALKKAAPKELAEYNKAVFEEAPAAASEKKAAGSGPPPAPKSGPDPAKASAKAGSHFEARPPLKAAAGRPDPPAGKKKAGSAPGASQRSLARDSAL